ncbi:MAG TPA: hypothetical protein ENL16_03730 [Candidatus Woesearchaeota archaeon]|nr:hypothetical protein [Candidatus Woesearchaeota archaeon]
MGLGQAAFEYLMVVGIALLLIVPGAVLFYNYSVKSGDMLARSKIDLAGSEIIDSVEKVYYIGESSWETIRVDFPDNVRDIYILNNEELVVEYDTSVGVSESVFFSDINMTTSYPAGGGRSNISSSPHPGLNVIKVISMGDYVLINETR